MAPRRTTLEAVARVVLITSAAYYGLDESLIPDSEFDAHCKRLHEEYDDLDRVMRWKLGDPQAIRASGYHVKLSEKDLGGLAEWLRRKASLRYQIVAKWNFPKPDCDPEFKFKWTEAADVSWNIRNPIA